MVVVGVGNELRGDDGAGVAVARLVREGCAASARLAAQFDVEEEQNELSALIDRWRGRSAAVVIDRGGGQRPASCLARRGELPPRVIVYAIEGRAFEVGSAMSDEVLAALPVLAAQVLEEALRLASACSDVSAK